MTAIPPAAAQTIRTAALTAHQHYPGQPAAIARAVAEALTDDGWQITPAPVEDQELPDIPPERTAP
ncbi:hypothetical protein ACWDRR_43380 [Kitasatospora sp. NPDC003701]